MTTQQRPAASAAPTPAQPASPSIDAGHLSSSAQATPGGQATPGEEPLVIDVWSDVACPWCFIGKRRLEAALRDAPAGSAVVRWHAFQLAPDLPPAGVDAVAHYTRKFGPMFPRMHARVAAVAAEDGLCFGPLHTAANTRLAHRLIAIAQAGGFGDDVVHALFSAHHERGVNVGDLDRVLAFFGERGIAPEHIAALRAGIDRGEGDDVVDADLAAAGELGIQGVPFFVAGGRVAVSGAQPVEVFQRFLEQARAPRPA